MKQFSFISIILLILCMISPVMHGKTNKYALVIGNGDYKQSPLKNTKNDAVDVAKNLKEKGFTVQQVLNANHRKMVTEIRKFGNKLFRGGIGLFYYAGHGVQVKGRNYLIPVNADIETEDDVEFNAVDAGFVLSRMESANNTMNIIILDACRDNPFARSFRSLSRGLAKMDAPRGSIIIYATSPGSIAADGAGRNGVFTKHLLRLMDTPGLEIAAMLREVRRHVLRDTGGKQLPWESSSLMEDFYFTQGEKIAAKGPGEVKLDFSDIETEKRWRKWQTDFTAGIDRATAYEQDPNISENTIKQMWKQIKEQFSTDNPLSEEDERLRKLVNTKIEYYNKEKGMQEIRFSAFPYAELIIDGKSYGEIPPLKKLELKEGRHILIFKKGVEQVKKVIYVDKTQPGFFYHDF